MIGPSRLHVVTKFTLRIYYDDSASGAACRGVEINQALLFEHYRLGLELLVLNGVLVFAGLLLISIPRQAAPDALSS